MNGNEESSTNGTIERLEHVHHWWREPLAGSVAIGIGAFDVWHYGRSEGFSVSLDEILVLSGIALIAGVRNLFSGRPPQSPGAQK